MLEHLWLPLLVVAFALYGVLEPQRKKFLRNRKKEQAKPERYRLFP
jgi:hypothetical protein